MNQGGRRTSGEIVNATLLEIFLSFIFVVLALAVFAGGRHRDASADATRWQEQAEQLQQEVDSLRGALATAVASLDSLRQAYESLLDRYVSEFAPRCSLGGGTRYLLAFRLTEPARWTAEVLEDLPPFRRGQELTVTPVSYTIQFEPLRRISYEERKCRFAVLVYDSERITKREYQGALNVIRRYFYVAERWQ